MKAQWISAALMLLIAAACSPKELQQEVPSSRINTIKVNAITEEPGQESRVSFSGTAPNYHTAWSAGDFIYVKENIAGTYIETGNYDDYLWSAEATSDPLEADADKASFKVSFDHEYFDECYVPYYKDLKYSYFASTSYLYSQTDGEGNVFYTLTIPPEQTVRPGRLSQEADLLVSECIETDEVPSELSLKFARVGTIVKVNLSGVTPSEAPYAGNMLTGDKFPATNFMECANTFFPETGELTILGGTREVGFINDEDDPIIADASGNATVLLRTFAGELDDWFCFYVYPDEESYYNKVPSFSKYVNLAELNRKLEFKEGGVTEFNVALKPSIVDNPTLDYTTTNSSNRDGFKAFWEPVEHAASYECTYYFSYDEEAGSSIGSGDDDDDIVQIPLDTYMEDGKVCVSVPSGLNKGIYTLTLRAVPDSESGPLWQEALVRDLYVGKPLIMNISADNATKVEGSEGSYTLTDWEGIESIQIWADNASFDDTVNSLSSDDDTKKFIIKSDQDFPAGLSELYFELHKYWDATYFANIEVYGIDINGNEVLLEPAEATEVESSSTYWIYSYDLSPYVGFKFVGEAKALLERFCLCYYK